MHRIHMNRLRFALAGALLASLGCRTAPAPAPARVPTSRALDTAAVLASARAEIDAANAAWVPGLRQRDAGAIVAAYADSGLFIGPDGTVTRGREAIGAMYAARFPRLREILDGAVEQDGMVAVAPDRIYEWGHAWLEMAPAQAGGRPVRSGGAYLTVWQRGADGHWRIVRNVAL